MNSLDRFKEILLLEARTIERIPVTPAIDSAISLLLECRGKVFTTGIGKAGYVAQKAASTFSTTGTPAAYIHPGDAAHGDVGVVGTGDILIAFSNSGKTREVIETLHFCKQLGLAGSICVSSCNDSPLATESDIVLELGAIEEACPFGLTPTASTAAMHALADALALTVMEKRGFSKQDFAIRHHGGYLGKKSRE